MTSAPRHLILIESAKRPPSPSDEVETADLLWRKLREEAQDAYDDEPNLASLLRRSVLDRAGFEDAVVHRVAGRLANELVAGAQIVAAFGAALQDNPEIGAGLVG